MPKSPMICEVCQEPIAPGAEAELSQEELKLHAESGKSGSGLFKHKDANDCSRENKG